MMVAVAVVILMTIFSTAKMSLRKKTRIFGYDLTNQDRVIRGRMPVLELIYERFIRSFRVSLSNSLKNINNFDDLN